MPFFKTTDGINLHYRITGKGKPIIFVHGWAMNSNVWKYQSNKLAKDFQVIAVDLRGHGKSECRMQNAECGFTIFVQDLKELINFLGIEKFTLAGWSMASFIIARYYFKYLEDVEKLIFISGTPKFLSGNDYPHGQPLIMVKRLEQNLKRDYENHIREFCGKLFISDEQIDDSKLSEIESLMFNEDFPPPLSTALHTLNLLIMDNIRDNLRDIKVPTLIIHGDIDKICPVGAGKYIAREIPDSKLIILKGVGHAPFLTQPERVNKEIKDFCHNLATN
ncbi:MAG: alpha/beta hydrolase [Nitrospinae bacterium]|nr:alpha/beta hydrolase [Nitrospinota bacterium]